MRYRKLPTDLKCRVHEYYYQRYHGHFFDEEAILGELSHALSEVGEIFKTGTSSVNSYTQYTHTAHTHTHTHTHSTENCQLQLSGAGQGGTFFCQC